MGGLLPTTVTQPAESEGFVEDLMGKPALATDANQQTRQLQRIKAVNQFATKENQQTRQIQRMQYYSKPTNRSCLRKAHKLRIELSTQRALYKKLPIIMFLKVVNSYDISYT